MVTDKLIITDRGKKEKRINYIHTVLNFKQLQIAVFPQRGINRQQLQLNLDPFSTLVSCFYITICTSDIEHLLSTATVEHSKGTSVIQEEHLTLCTIVTTFQRGTFD